MFSAHFLLWVVLARVGWACVEGGAWWVTGLLGLWLLANAVLVVVSVAAANWRDGAAAADLVGVPWGVKSPWGERSWEAKVALAPFRLVGAALRACDAGAWVARGVAWVSGHPPPRSSGQPWTRVPGTNILVGRVGHRPLPVTVSVVVDMTTEWEWPCPVDLVCIPTLDDCLGDPVGLADVALEVGRRPLAKGDVYVGCAFGVGRSAAMGALCATAARPDLYPTWDAAVDALKHVRPEVSTTPLQRRVARAAHARVLAAVRAARVDVP
jgi:hypothetical protein